MDQNVAADWRISRHRFVLGFARPLSLDPDFDYQDAHQYKSSSDKALASHYQLFTVHQHSSLARVVEWQTRTFEGRMPKGMRVQVPPRALKCGSGWARRVRLAANKIDTVEFPSSMHQNHPPYENSCTLRRTDVRSFV